jgi:hypothetical protein
MSVRTRNEVLLPRNGWYTQDTLLEERPALAGWRGLKNPDIARELNRTLYLFKQVAPPTAHSLLLAAQTHRPSHRVYISRQGWGPSSKILTNLHVPFSLMYLGDVSIAPCMTPTPFLWDLLLPLKAGFASTRRLYFWFVNQETPPKDSSLRCAGTCVARACLPWAWRVAGLPDSCIRTDAVWQALGQSKPLLFFLWDPHPLLAK